jgi:putative flippase GtrA
VFKAAHRPVFMQVNAYVIAAIVSWWTVLGAVSLLIALFHISTMEARVVSIPALFPLNYLVSKYFIFKK